jgi:hypothetical protein
MNTITFNRSATNDAPTEKELDATMHEKETTEWLTENTDFYWAPIDPIGSFYCPIDGFIGTQFEDGTKITAAYELKCRNLSLQDFNDNYGNYWLVSYSKIEHARTLTKTLGIPFIVAVRLIKDDKIMLKQLWDGRGNLTCEMTVSQTTTKKNVNGGSATRPNAFIRMDDCEILDMTLPQYKSI